MAEPNQGRRLRDFPPTTVLTADQIIPVDGPNQPGAQAATLGTLRTWLNIPSSSGGNGGGGSSPPLVNVGTGIGVFAGLAGTPLENQLRSLKSSSSSLALTVSGGDIVFNLSYSDIASQIPAATTSAAGMMSAADKVKLNTYPSAYAPIVINNAGSGSPVYMGSSGGTERFRTFKSSTPSLGITTNTDDLTLAIANATASVHGLMSSTDKAKLDLYPATPSGGGGSSGYPLINIGTGAGIFAGVSPTLENQLRTLKSSTSALAMTVAGSEVVFTVNFAEISNQLSDATTTTSGKMSATDKTKLNAYPATPSQITPVTISTAGLMAPTDKVKLDTYPATYTPPSLLSLGTGAAVYVGQSGGVERFRSLISGHAAVTLATTTNDITFNFAVASSSLAGLMSAADKVKIDLYPANPNLLPDATASVHGYMSAADKAKLDGIPVGGGGGAGGGLPPINIGTGQGIFASATVTNYEFRSLKSNSSPLALAVSGGDITFTLDYAILNGQMPPATSSGAGTMSAVDKAKLDTYPATPAQIAVATGTTPGHMSTADKSKLDTYPATASALPLATTTTQGQLSSGDKTKLDAYPSAPNLIAPATTSVNGLMSATDKTKLNTYPATYAPVVLTNVGTGAQIYAGAAAGTEKLRTLKSAHPSVTLSTATDDITFNFGTATTTTSGLMSAADKLKLDGLSTGPSGPPGVDLVVNNATATYLDYSAAAFGGAWVILVDQADPENNALAIADFTNGKLAFYSSAGVGLLMEHNQFNATTGVLTGTTGTSGKINVSATTNSRLYIENRRGTNLALRYFVGGSGSGGPGATNLDSLTDVVIATPVSGEVLTFDVASGSWKNKPPTGGGGVTNPMFIGDAAPNNTAFEYHTTTGTFSITTSQGTDSSIVEFLPTGDILLDGQSLKPTIDLITAISQVNAIAAQAAGYRDQALAHSVTASKWAAAPPGQIISGGMESALSYAEKARNIASISRILPTKIVLDAQITSGVYTLLAGDLFKILIMRNTAPCTINCPPYLWVNTNGEAWSVIRREGAAVTVAPSVGSSAFPTLLASRGIVRRFSTPTIGTATISEVLNIPSVGGVSSKVIYFSQSSFDSAVAHPLTLTATGGGIATSTHFYDDNAAVGNDVIKLNAWQFNLATGWSGADVTFNLGAPAGLTSLAGWVVVLRNAGNRDTTVGSYKSSGVASDISMPYTVGGTFRFVLSSVAQRSHNGLPAFFGGRLLSVGQESTIGLAGGDDTDRFKNMVSMFGYNLELTSGAQTYNTRFAAADGPTSGMVVAYPVSSAGSITPTLNKAGDRDTIAETMGSGTLHAAGDGLSYWFETAKP
jgi:hypothetical protein